ncbi:uncharacterized protein BDW70DRAFT_73342 [Aspergillus foveolatus]|uniref:uncharacterized protein n=1 Tax=Aspergillus foveolatus TaxID=210207 RepID=UPI003CCD0DE4
MGFEFVNNNTAIDSAARRRIRTHAATGKNANRTLTRPSKAVVLRRNVAVPFRTPETIRRLQRDSKANAEIERPVTDGLQFLIPVPARSQGLVRQALFFFTGVRYNPELEGAVENPDHMGSVWVRYLFLDEAYFHCSVATSILCSKSLVRETTQGMYHIARTYRIVQDRLMSEEEATSDMTIAILVAMSQYERLQGQYARGYVHVRGMRRMIELRGGIKQFNSDCCGVIQKVLRADLEYALQLGLATLFGFEGIEFLRECKGICLNDGKEEKLVANPEVDSFLQNGVRLSLWSTFSNMRRLADLLNDTGAGYRRKLGADEFHNTILLLGYSLLHISPLDVSTGPGACSMLGVSPLEEVVHLGLVAFLVTFLRGLNQRIPENPLLSHRLRLAVDKLVSSVKGGEESKIIKRVLVWALFVGAVVVFKTSDDEWLIPTTNTAMNALGLSSWKDVKEALAGFPWVDAIHNRTGTVLCTTQRSLSFSTQFD